MTEQQSEKTTVIVPVEAMDDLIGLFGVAAALNGFVYKKIPMLFRLAMAAGGLCMMIPGTASDVVGLVVVGGIVLIQRMSARRLAA